MGNQRADTTFLQAIGICLIVNSHMDNFYSIRLLATGGTIGNSIFFMLSSLGLYLSWQEKNDRFVNWYGRRIARIYPSVWVVLLFLAFPYEIYLGSLRTDNLLEKMGMLYFPPFWFLRALMIFYFATFFILRNYSKRLLVLLSISLLVMYGIYYSFLLDLNSFSISQLPFTLILYFLVFLEGLYLGSIKGKIYYSGILDVLGLTLCIGCIYLHKFLMYRGFLSSFQFIQDIAIFPMLYFFLKIASSALIKQKLMQNLVIGRIADFLSKNTLEIYMAHSTLRGIFEQFKVGFPINVVAFVLTSVGAAFLVSKCSYYVKRLFELGEKTQTES